MRSALRAIGRRRTTSTSCNSRSGSAPRFPASPSQEHPWRELSDALRRLPGVDTVAIFMVDEPQHRLVVTQHVRHSCSTARGVFDGNGRPDQRLGCCHGPANDQRRGWSRLVRYSRNSPAYGYRRSVFNAGGSQGRADTVFNKGRTRSRRCIIGCSLLPYRLCNRLGASAPGSTMRQYRRSSSAVAAAKETFRPHRRGQLSRAILVPDGSSGPRLAKRRRAAFSVTSGLLERMGQLQDTPLVAMTANNLQTDR